MPRGRPGVPTPILSGTLADRPAFGVVDRYYWATDVQMLYRDTGAAWDAIAHGNLENVAFAQHHDHYARMLYGVLAKSGWSPLTLDTAGRVMLVPIQIEFQMTLDRIGLLKGATIAGNLIVGIYEDNGDTPFDGALVVESASVAMSAGTFRKQEITIANTLLDPALYWLAIETDDTTAVVYGFPSTLSYEGTLQAYYYDRAGGYGALTDPCPAVVRESEAPVLYVRVASVP